MSKKKKSTNSLSELLEKSKNITPNICLPESKTQKIDEKKILRPYIDLDKFSPLDMFEHNSGTIQPQIGHNSATIRPQHQAQIGHKSTTIRARPLNISSTIRAHNRPHNRPQNRPQNHPP